MRAVGKLIEVRTKVAPPIRWIKRWPAVILAVSRTARAMGWIKRLIVSMIISMGIRGRGVPWGRKWASEDLVLWRKPINTVPAHRGIAIPRFMDSCVVGVNVWGRRPRRLVVPMKIIRDNNISDHVRPFGEWIIIICLVIILISQSWRVSRRFVEMREDEVMNMVGIIIMKMTIGRPIIVGVAKEANRFSFMLFLRGHWSLLFELI